MNDEQIVFYRITRHIPKKYHKFFKDNFGNDYRRRLNTNSVWFLAILDKKLVGCTCIEYTGNMDNMIIFGGSRVDEKYRGNGIYRNLLNLKFDYMQDKVNESQLSHTIHAFCRDTTVDKFIRMGFERTFVRWPDYPTHTWVTKEFYPEEE